MNNKFIGFLTFLLPELKRKVTKEKSSVRRSNTAEKTAKNAAVSAKPHKLASTLSLF